MSVSLTKDYSSFVQNNVTNYINFGFILRLLSVKINERLAIKRFKTCQEPVGVKLVCLLWQFSSSAACHSILSNCLSL